MEAEGSKIEGMVGPGRGREGRMFGDGNGGVRVL